MKKLLFILFTLTVLTSCEEEQNQTDYSASEIHRIPYGQTGTLIPGDYTGQGTVTVAAGTTVNIDGITTIDGLAMTGKVHVPSNAVLIVNGPLNVGGGTNLDVEGTVLTADLIQVGNVYLNNAFVAVDNRYTIGGGTTLYTANSQIEASELIITGNIQGIDNLITQATNWYTLFELTGSQYLNRGGGTTVCGPVLFNHDHDLGSSGIGMTNVTDDALDFNPFLKIIYGLPETAKLYEYYDVCTPLIEMPAH